MPLKKYLRLFLINFLCLWLVARIIPGIVLKENLQTLAMAALALMVVNLLLKPFIKLLLLPINLLTLGAFRWLVNVAALYLVTMAVPEFEIHAFFFPGFNYQGFVIPSVHLGIFWVYVLTSLLISLTTSIILWLSH